MEVFILKRGFKKGRDFDKIFISVVEVEFDYGGLVFVESSMILVIVLKKSCVYRKKMKDFVEFGIVVLFRLLG